jgi:multidrug efflux system membrane fusion protein
MSGMKEVLVTRTIHTLAALILAGCGGEVPPAPPLPVTVHAVASGGGAGGLRYSASVRPDVQVDVAFKVSGYIDQVLQVRGADGRLRAIQDGDYVRRGTVLARVRDNEYRDAAAQTQASLTQAKADFDRVSQMFESRSASKADYDAAYARYTAAQAQHDQAEIALADCALRAPMDGYLLRRAVEVGSLVAAGTPGFTVADTRAMKVVFGVPDVMVGSMKMGAAQNVTTEAVPGKVLRGRITRVAPSADATSRVFEVEVTIPNGEGRLRAGMIAALQVADAPATRSAPMPVVPLNAVVRPPRDPKGFAVYVVEGDSQPRAKLRTVQLGGIEGNLVQITGGIQAGDRVIVRGATLVVDSQVVQIIP